MVVGAMARSTYYYWSRANEAPDLYARAKELIKGIFHQHKGRYGYRRIMLALRNMGCWLNHKTVQKLMGELKLKSLVRPKRYKSYRGDMARSTPNTLAQGFEAAKPNEKWVTDVTEFNVRGEKVYLSPILDLYNREIVSYEVADSPQMGLVMEMLNKAFAMLKAEDRPLLHSDQGWQYQMRHYQQKLRERGLEQSMSRKGNCLDNAVIENFFGILKTEFFHGKRFESVESFKTGLDEYMRYYNHDRIKEKLKGLSPVQYRIQSLKVA
jgi:transposase InsO family protein